MTTTATVQTKKCTRCRGTGRIMVRGMTQPEPCTRCGGSGREQVVAK